MKNGFGVDSMTGTLNRVGMRRPGAILSADSNLWHYAKPINPEALSRQYDEFVRLVEASGAEIHWLAEDAEDGLADSVFTYDSSFVVADGAIIMRPGKELRMPEAQLHHDFYTTIGMPILGTIEGEGRIEGGDCFFLDATTLVVGRGHRTNQAGIEQFRAILEPRGMVVESYDLPYLHGPEACLHLMSVISPLDRDLALVYAPLVPTALYERMEAMGYTLLHAPAEEFEASLGLNLNVLATGPRQCIAVDGFHQTQEVMRAAGCDVQVFLADELCLPCEGGPTCLTRPLSRG